MSFPELTDFDVDLIEFLTDRKWDEAACLIRGRAANGLPISHPRALEALACRMTPEGRKKPRGRQRESLFEDLDLGAEIEKEMQGTSPLQAFRDVVNLRPQTTKPVPHGESLNWLNETAERMNVSQSKAEKARAVYNRFMKVANQRDPPKD